MKLDVWCEIVVQWVSCYYGMEVWDKDSFGYISFDDQSMGFSYFGYIIENVVVYYVLWQKVQCCVDVILLVLVEFQQVVWGENEVFFSLQDGSMLIVWLVIGVDGVNLWLCNKVDILLIFWDYYYYVLVVIICIVELYQVVVCQVFYGDGIFVFLLFSDLYLCLIVWLLLLGEVQWMQQVDEIIFNQVLNIVFDNCFGFCQLVSECEVFLLIGCYVCQFVVYWLVLVGDVVYIIYLLVGQGVNFGFMDVVEFIDELKCLYVQGKDIGQYFYLCCYECSCKYSVVLMLVGMQGFCEMFFGSYLVKKFFCDVGFKLVDMLSGVKLQLICQVMGFNDLFVWLC